MAATEAQLRKGVSRGTTMLFTPLSGVHGASLHATASILAR